MRIVELGGENFTTPAQVTVAIEAAALVGVDVSGLAATPPSALARLRAVLCTFRNLRPVVLGWAGSSAWFGSAATNTGRRAVNIATGKIQARYPLASGTEVATRALSVAVAELPFTPGIQSVNAGVGGTIAANYLTETTRAQLMSTAPDAIMHMILSNDFKFQTPLATFKATLLSQINALDALATGVPPIHMLLQPHERYSPRRFHSRSTGA
jgi:hypothetical protein